MRELSPVFILTDGGVDAKYVKKYEDDNVNKTKLVVTIKHEVLLILLFILLELFW